MLNLDLAEFLGEGHTLGGEELDSVDFAETLVVGAEGGEHDGGEVEAERLTSGDVRARGERLVVVFKHLLGHGCVGDQECWISAHPHQREGPELLSNAGKGSVRSLLIVH